MAIYNRLFIFSGCALVFCLSTIPALANEEIHDDDHAALIKHYEASADDAKMRLHENQSQLEKYESHPYYYGRQGQDFRSHMLANIHEYEKQLNDHLRNAELHKKILSEQHLTANESRISIENHARSVR